MNLLFRAMASKDNFVLNLLEQLREKGCFEHCTVISQTLDYNDRFIGNFYHEIKAGYGYTCAYDQICNLDELPAIPGEILEKMKKYKADIMDMVHRGYDVHIHVYDELEKIYIDHVRFWNWVLDKDKIGMCFFACIPHTSWEYTIYALAKVKSIPTLLIDATWIPGLSEIGTSIENLGHNAKRCYNRHEEIDVPSKYEESFWNDKKKTKESLPKNEIKRLAREIKNYHNKFFRKPFFMSFAILCKHTLDYYCLKKYTKVCLLKEKDEFKYGIRQKIKLMKIEGISYYERKLVQNVNLEDKYIIYFIHQMPEASTLPKAGVFSNQLLAIRILAEAAKKKNIKLYVKEHWCQVAPVKGFYEQLGKIPNVYCVSSEVNSFTLIDRAILVASCTGSCILEAFIRGIPSVMFGYNSACNAPLAYKVSNVEEVASVIDTVVRGGCEYDLNSAKKYYAAICKTCVREYLDWPSDESERVYSVEECTNDIINLIAGFIQKGMPKEYYFER